MQTDFHPIYLVLYCNMNYEYSLKSHLELQSLSIGILCILDENGIWNREKKNSRKTCHHMNSLNCFKVFQWFFLKNS